MNNSIRRVSARHLKVAESLVDELQHNLNGLSSFVQRLSGYLSAVDDLIIAGERRRLGRVSGMTVGPISNDVNRVFATVTGLTGKYETRITLLPKRGHHCTCPDWEKNGRNVGPCKHVLALGFKWKYETLDPAADQANEKMVDVTWTPL